MSFTYLVGLRLTDAAAYADYRAGMRPILEERFGGHFGVDVEVARVLESPADGHFDRLFTISFPDRATAGAFFADEDYLAVKAAHFDRAVGAAYILATFGG